MPAAFRMLVLRGVAALLVASAASGARALPVCEEELSLEPLLPPQAAPPVVASAALPIVPCAMVESGVLGPACADATFYVVTDTGVMLCSVDIDTFALTQAPTTQVETAPAAAAASTGAGTSALALAPEGVRVPPSFARVCVTALGAALAPPPDRSDRPPVPPS